MVIPREFKNIDTLEFCQLLKITKEDYHKKIQAKAYSPRLSRYFNTTIKQKELRFFQEKIRKFEGFYFKTFTKRHTKSILS
jgi:penicillin-binding protein 2